MKLKTRNKIYLLVFAIVPVALADEQPDPLSEPTQHGLRLTPALARAFARQWLMDRMGPELALTQDQQNQLSESAARRLMDTARNHQEQTQPFLEYMLENVLSGRRQVTPETGRQFAERSSPLIPAFRDFVDGVSQDARTVLTAEEMTHFEKRMQREHTGINNFETKMQRWAQGQAGPDEQPFTELEPDQPRIGDAKTASTAVSRRAVRRATFSLSSLGPPQWERFLAGAKRLYGFDEKQSAQAEQILVQYRDQADRIMTPEWKKALQQNRIKYNLRGALQQNAIAPWLYHLDQEFNRSVAPLSDLGQKFRDEVLALVTDLQRAAVAQSVEQLAAAHGLKWEGPDKTTLGLNGPQGSGPSSN